MTRREIDEPWKPEEVLHGLGLRVAIVPRRETFYDPGLMSIIAHAKLVPAMGCLLVATTVFVLQGCGGDHEDPGSGVAAACSSSCSATAGQCNLPVVTAQNCATLCDVGYTLAPACAAAYQTYVDCSGA